jgi:hypothetical protein
VRNVAALSLRATLTYGSTAASGAIAVFHVPSSPFHTNRLIAGELPRARSFPVTSRVLPDRIAPANPYPIAFRGNGRPVFAAKDRSAVYDFSAQSWSGKIGPNGAAWQGGCRSPQIL